MANYLSDNDDLRFYLGEGVPWDELAAITEYDFRDPEGHASAVEARDFYRDILELIGTLASDEIAPRAAAIDRIGNRLVDGKVETSDEFALIFAKLRELDLHRMCLPRAVGGLNCPLIVYFIAVELLARADVSVMSHFGFHGGIAAAMLLFSMLEGSTELGQEPWQIARTRFAEEIEEIASGQAWGSMDITEPDAGSDMAALRATAEQDASGQWLVSGQKIFITSGHGKYHFVIARTSELADSSDLMAGLEGLSLFLVPTYRDEADGTRVRLASLDRIEDKLGHHGSVTAAVTFDRTPAHLIGQPGEGFKHMLMLMNNARVGVGFESIGLCEAAYRLARAYAAERRSMGKTLDRHEMIADYLDEMEVDILGLRAIAVRAGVREELGQKIRLKLAVGNVDSVTAKRLERTAKKHKRAARRITPLLKYLAAEKAVEMARRCVQIHGGNGYMREFGAERLLRDAVVMPIYEGTSQIQALMAMKDTLGSIIAEPQEFVKRIAQVRWRALSARDPLERRVAKLSQLSLSVQQHLITKTAADKFRALHDQPIAEWPTRLVKNWDPKRDFAFAMLHAERLTRMLADEVICEELLRQSKRHDERRAILARYLERAEPRCRFLADQITSGGTRLLAELGGVHEAGTAAKA